MSAEKRPTRRRAKLPSGRLIVPGLCVSVAALLFWLTVPRAAAGWILFDSESALTSLRLGQTVSSIARERLLARQRSAIGWSNAGGLSIDYGFALMASEAQSTSSKAGSAKKINVAADKALRKGLSQMPVNAVGWYLLAVLQRRATGNSTEAVSAIRMSVFAGPYVPVLAVLRLRLMLRLWPKFSKDEWPMVYRQIQYAWSVAPDDVVEIAVNSRNDWPIRIALALQPTQLQRFEEKLLAAKKKKAAPSK